MSTDQEEREFNNASESINAVLKKDIDWKPQKFRGLKEMIDSMVTHNACLTKRNIKK